MYWLSLISFFVISSLKLINADLNTKNDFNIECTQQDEELFERDRGLWFLNDANLPVRAYFNLSSLKKSEIGIEKNVFFYLYTKDSEVSYTLRINDSRNLGISGFDPTKETIFITHGLMNSASSPSCVLIKDAFLEHGDYNVIVFDWSIVSYQFTAYSSVAVEIPNIAKLVLEMAIFLETEGLSLKNMSLVGHGLGAHIMGIAGYNLKRRVGYVVGLDPALPCFRAAIPGERISEYDGLYVEIIHTNAGNHGFTERIGTADFYPNGGSHMSGCEGAPPAISLCSHTRSYQYFAESINSKIKFQGRSCDSLVAAQTGKCQGSTGQLGGIKNKRRQHGLFYLATNDRKPYVTVNQDQLEQRDTRTIQNLDQVPILTRIPEGDQAYVLNRFNQKSNHPDGAMSPHYEYPESTNTSNQSETVKLEVFVFIISCCLHLPW